ncbi:MAG: response regulator transcription factor [Magnetococcales bacterium]|nr:response regulator transcription factor [Magnetococcales bacterium]MBF0260770.1 response regulator transcription factor [Magnetococcales bacterium]
MRILIIEDDSILAQHLKRKCESAGFSVDITQHGLDGEAMANQLAYHAVILDLGLPDHPGLTILKNWRRGRNPVPVIVLTARNSWQERVVGIEAGADDYLGKPFHVEELLARLRALIMRCHARFQGQLNVGGYTLEEERQAVIKPDGELVQLTSMEFRLLRVFMLSPGRIHSKDALIDVLYDFDKIMDHNVIEVYINHLRKKLGRDIIRTLRWQGYQFMPGT